MSLHGFCRVDGQEYADDSCDVKQIGMVFAVLSTGFYAFTVARLTQYVQQDFTFLALL